MCLWQDEHPEEKPKTMGDHMKFLNKFGFEIARRLTPKEEKIEGVVRFSHALKNVHDSIIFR